LKIPKKVKILDNYFKIKLKNRIIEEAAEAYGSTSYFDKHEISLQKDQPNIKNTLLHEIIHAIEKTQGLKLEEKQVFFLANYLRTVMLDNPELIEIFKGG